MADGHPRTSRRPKRIRLTLETHHNRGSEGTFCITPDGVAAKTSIEEAHS